MTPKRPYATTATLALTVYSLSQQGVYTKGMITFEGDFHCDIELPLCLYQKPDGDFEFTIEEQHPAIELPEQPDPEVPPRTRGTRDLSVTDTVLVSARVTVRRVRPILPENPTAKDRWEYLLAVLRQTA